MRIRDGQNRYNNKILHENNFQQKKTNFSGLAEKLADSIPDKVLKNSGVHSFCKMAEKNASLFDVTTALLMGTTIGAGGVLISPFNKKEDKQYMASQLIMNCAVSFLISLAVYLPLAKSMSKLGEMALDVAAKSKGFPYKKGTKEYDGFNYIVNYGSRFVIAPIQSFFIIKGITPLFNKLFNKKEGSK